MRSWLVRRSRVVPHHPARCNSLPSISNPGPDALVAWAIRFHERVAQLEAGTSGIDDARGVVLPVVAPPRELASRTEKTNGMLSGNNNNSGSSSLTSSREGYLGSPDHAPRNPAHADLELLLCAPPCADTRLLTSMLVAGQDLKSLLSLSGSSGRLDGMRRVEDKDLSRTDLTGVALVDCEFHNCDFSRSILYRASVSGSTRFSQCSFRGAILQRFDVQAQGSSFGVPRFVNCSFEYCILEFATITACNGDNPSFNKAAPAQQQHPQGTPLFECCSFYFAELRVPRQQQWLFRNCRGVRLAYDT